MEARKYLGIDYGTKRIGLSLSDEGGIFAFPKTIVENDGKAVNAIRDIIAAENVGAMVVGESLDFKGRPNAVAEEADAFIRVLQTFDIPVYLEKEFLTSVEARRSLDASRPYKPGRRERVDASAAAIILQRYLDRMNEARKPYR